MLWLWLACTVSGPDKLAVDKSVPLQSAKVACMEHADPDLVGKCMVRALEARDQLNLGQCAAVTGRWRGLCILQVEKRDHGALGTRYSRCKDTSGDPRTCRFLLWQNDVMALQPGHPDHALELEGMRELVKQHKHHVGDINPLVDDEMWVWFWGAWWEQRQTQDDRGRALTRCNEFPSPIDVRLCREWSSAAFEWIASRIHPPAQE